MKIPRSGAASGLALAFVFAPLAASAADAEVGGKGPRIRSHAGRPVATFERPVFLVVDGLADLGSPRPAQSPPLVIEVEGDVEIVPQPDGSIRIRFPDDDA